MPESRSHKITANRIAKKLNAEYNSSEGPDIVTNKLVVEVESADTMPDAVRQLRGFRKPVYIAGPNQEAVEKALEATEGTTVGVMDNQGKIIRKSTETKYKLKRLDLIKNNIHKYDDKYKLYVYVRRLGYRMSRKTFDRDIKIIENSK